MNDGALYKTVGTTLTMLDADYPADFAAWNEAIERLPHCRRDMHWLPGYAKAYASLTPGARALAARWQAGEATVLQPFIKVGPKLTSPYGFGGPVCSMIEGPPAHLHRRYRDDLGEWARGESVEAEWCRLHPLMAEHQRHVLERAAPVRVEAEKIVCWIDLTRNLGDNIGVTKGHRAAIARAARLGVKVHASTQEYDLRWFYDAYTETMRRHDAEDKWLFPYQFMERLTAASSAAWAVLVAYREDGTPEAGALMLGAYDTAYYHYAGRRLVIPEIGAGHLLVQACALWAQAHGYKRLHLGGATTTAPLDPLLRFKRGFTEDTAWTYVYRRTFAP